MSKGLITEPEQVKKTVAKVSAVSVFFNALLVVFKLFAGIVAGSGAMVSDAVHSMSDIIATIIAYVGVRMSNKEPDVDHPYGHERLECIAALLLALILFGTGAGIGYAGILNIVTGEYEELMVPGLLALIAAIVSIVIKEAMFWYTRYYAKLIRSSAFMADAWHHRSDAISSVGALIGIAFARTGYPVMDSVASILICLFIFKAAYDIMRDAIRRLTDHSCSEEVVKDIKDHIISQDGVHGIDDIKTRLFGNRIYVEAEIRVNGELTLREAHDIAQTVHDSLEEQFPDIKHVMIHVNPD